ncbi:MAG: AAA family ATPase [Acidimicrobiales bacterium]
MLTRLEVNGFKNLLDMQVEFGPFTCIAGENGAGKSNIFDAIQFLSLLADHSLMEAAQEVRSTRDERTGDPRDLFWIGYTDGNPVMSFSAEMIVPEHVLDDFGQSAEATTTFLRYELRIGYEAPHGPERIGRLVLLSETLRHIKLGDAAARLRFPHSVDRFRRNVVRGRRSGKAFISTELDGEDRTITIHQDLQRGRHSGGRLRRASAVRAPTTVVSTITGADDPTILAARREMQSWRRLSLEPSALRAADRYTDRRTMGPDGRHLAATLYRIAISKSPENEKIHPEDIYATVASRLASLTGLAVRHLRVDTDDTRELLTVQLREAGGIELPARSLSEGTLRFLALCVLLEDSTVSGLLCMEEPENGLHPANLPAMVEILQDLAVDPKLAPGPDNPVRQVIVNTHSPGVVQLVDPNDLLYATVVAAQRSDGTTARELRLQPLQGTWRAVGIREPAATRSDLVAYLTTPPGAHFEFTLQSA